MENINCQTITPASGKNPRQLYEHQEEAIRRIDAINKKDTFRSLLVLPTGGGKTLTAAYWLLKNAVDKEKKQSSISNPPKKSTPERMTKNK